MIDCGKGQHFNAGCLLMMSENALTASFIWAAAINCTPRWIWLSMVLLPERLQICHGEALATRLTWAKNFRHAGCRAFQPQFRRQNWL